MNPVRRLEREQPDAGVCGKLRCAGECLVLFFGLAVRIDVLEGGEVVGRKLVRAENVVRLRAAELVQPQRWLPPRYAVIALGIAYYVRAGLQPPAGNVEWRARCIV